MFSLIENKCHITDTSIVYYELIIDSAFIHFSQEKMAAISQAIFSDAVL